MYGVEEDAIEENSDGSSLHGCFAVVEGKRIQVCCARGEVMLCVACRVAVVLPATWLAVGGWRLADNLMWYFNNAAPMLT